MKGMWPIVHIRRDTAGFIWPPGIQNKLWLKMITDLMSVPSSPHKALKINIREGNEKLKQMAIPHPRLTPSQLVVVPFPRWNWDTIQVPIN